MATNIILATRKGLLKMVPDSDGWRIGDTAFIGDNVTNILTDPRDGALYAALDLGHFGVKLHRRDQGGDWCEISAPAFAEEKDTPAPDPMKEWPPKKVGPSVELI